MGVYLYMTFDLNNNKLYLLYSLYDMLKLDVNKSSEMMTNTTDTSEINMLNWLYFKTIINFTLWLSLIELHHYIVNYKTEFSCWAHNLICNTLRSTETEFRNESDDISNLERRNWKNGQSMCRSNNFKLSFKVDENKTEKFL